MKLQPASRREIKRITTGTVILDVLMIGAFAVLGLLKIMDFQLLPILLSTVMKEALTPVIEGTVLAKLGVNMISLFIVFGLLYWVSMSRQIRGQILSLREQEYVLAAQATGAQSKWIITKHLLPGFSSYLIVSLTLQVLLRL